MSGFEIAGLVLGAFPLLVGAAKPLSTYLQGSQRWWSFKNDFMGFLTTIEDESIAYSQNLELLLSPLNLDSDVQTSLQEDSASPFWGDGAIQSQLRQRIKEQYFTWFTGQLKEMRATLDELYNMLPMENGQVCYPRPGTMDYEKLRVKLSFSSRRQQLLDKVVRINETLYKFLSKDSQINGRTPYTETAWIPKSRGSNSPGSKKASAFMKLQSEARALSQAFQAQWSCRCPRAHHCGITTEWLQGRFESHKPSLKLLFGFWEGRAEVTQVRVGSLTADESLADSKTTPSSQTSREQVSELHRSLRQDMTEKQFGKMAEKRSVAFAAVSVSSTLVDPTHSIERKRESRKLTKVRGSIMKAIGISSFSSFSSLASSTGTTTESSTLISTSSSSSTAKSVRFSNTPIYESMKSSRQDNIEDICAFLKSTPTWIDAQHPTANYKTLSFTLDPPDRSELTKLEFEDLQSLSQSTPRLPDRLWVGLNIALTILGLGTSCWIPRGWDRREVFVMKSKVPNAKTIGPYFLHESLAVTLTEEMKDARIHAEAALFSLGVILLELTYQETLEQQSFWATYCEEDGRPNDWTHQCTAMEWQSRVEAYYGDDLSEPIRLCVEGRFSREADLGDSGFVQEVIDNVVVPIERFLSSWRKLS